MTIMSSKFRLFRTGNRKNDSIQSMILTNFLSHEEILIALIFPIVMQEDNLKFI